MWYVNVNFYESYAPFLYFTFAKFWFLDDNLWAKSQMYGMPFRHFLLKLLQYTRNYNITLCQQQFIIIFILLYFFLRKNGISYINPHVSGYNQRLIPIQVAAREKCRILLYVITHRTRSLSSMIEVSRGCQGEM